MEIDKEDSEIFSNLSVIPGDSSHMADAPLMFAEFAMRVQEVWCFLWIHSG